MPEVQELLRNCYGISQLKRETIQDVIDKVCYLIKKIIVKSLIPKEAIYDLRRSRLALSELLESGERGNSCVFVGSSFSQLP